MKPNFIRTLITYIGILYVGITLIPYLFKSAPPGTITLYGVLLAISAAEVSKWVHGKNAPKQKIIKDQQKLIRELKNLNLSLIKDNQTLLDELKYLVNLLNSKDK